MHLYADVVWPALFLEQQMLSIVPITVGLLVECIALRYGGFGLSWKRAAQVDLSMNAVSTFAGMFLLPLAGVSVIFAPGSWAWPLTVVMAVLVGFVRERQPGSTAPIGAPGEPDESFLCVTVR